MNRSPRTLGGNYRPNDCRGRYRGRPVRIPDAAPEKRAGGGGRSRFDKLRTGSCDAGTRRSRSPRRVFDRSSTLHFSHRRHLRKKHRRSPFRKSSDEKSNAYFADGIQDEILTRLSKIASLKVISRTSTQKYKSAPDNLRDIGKQLGVANLLEGSVQRAADAVHINVQLIRAATDEHLWAETYNRKLDDIFGVEAEVADDRGAAESHSDRR